MNSFLNASELFKRSITGLCIGILVSIIFFYFPPLVFSFFLLVLLAVMIFVEIPPLINSSMGLLEKSLVYSYPTTPTILLIFLNQNPIYRPLVALIFGFTFLNDVAAYFVGKYYGRHLLFPSISPKKTWEGFVGGFIAVFIAMVFVANYMNCSYPAMLLRLLFLSMWWAIIATAGDLFESFLKRQAHLKDSGSLLPGHGGLLDRLDSIFAVTVGVYLSRAFIGSFFCL